MKRRRGLADVQAAVEAQRVAKRAGSGGEMDESRGGELGLFRLVHVAGDFVRCRGGESVPTVDRNRPTGRPRLFSSGLGSRVADGGFVGADASKPASQQASRARAEIAVEHTPPQTNARAQPKN